MIERNLSDRYRLEGRIGQGGMAVVYAGIDTVLRRRVAVKVLREQLAADADFVQRFYTEAQHAAKLSHPNIVSIYDVGREGENYFIVMELVDGATLAEMIEHDVRLPEAVAIDFAAQICNGLAYAHRQGLLHRDVKPANILVTKDDVVKLSDFGIARAVTTQTVTMTQPGMVMGSVYYISPEQAQGHELHETSDLYSLGIIIYQMLTGKLPYTGESPITVALKHVSNPVPAVDADELSVSPALAAIVRKLMQKDPQQRFASALDVAKALREAREHPHVTAPFDVGGGADNGARPRTIPKPKPRPSKYPDRFPDAPDDEPRAAGAAAFAVPRGVTIAIAFVVLVLAIAAGYLATNRQRGFLGGPATVRIASLIGATSRDAQQRLGVVGLHATLVSVASETVPLDAVVRQDPAPGASVPSGGVVTLEISAGPPTLQLLDLRQMSGDDATRILRNQKLTAKILRKYDAAKEGTVLSQSPSAGATLAIHSTVTLVVSQGLKPEFVPSIVSQTLEDAGSTLSTRHLILRVAERDPNDHIVAGAIISQDPAAGAQLAPGSTVDVAVSSGPAQLAVPDLGSLQLADATGKLGALGFASTIVYAEEPTAPVGTVISQQPAASAALAKGSSVTLTVAVPGTVPDVSGKSPAQASTLLQNYGYKIGNTAYKQEGVEGTVVGTEPAAGTAEHPGATVTIYVSGTSAQP
ncbi:MAG: Stk1 family PASTA domain-containing Ser/Thr kinase [Candidatus Eremiobacteraeota bacterium]|nr:Stk1 family PASTA domain-containing Ser/Thr kinase [Candidatus Eremiobacteraeota bacterium]